MIVITGATGHIGNVLVRQLLEKGEKVKVLVLPGEDLTPIKGLDVEKAEGDIRNLESLVKAFRGADIVFHLAAVISILPGRKKLLQEVNVIGTRNVVEACVKCGVRRLVYTSSIHALFKEPPPQFIDETIPFDPDNIVGEYAKSKVRATLEVLKGLEKGLDVVVACPTGVMGPYDYRISEAGKTIIDVAKGKCPIYIDGNQDFADVRDSAKGIILCGEKGRKGEVYLLSGETISVTDLLLTASKISGAKMPKIKIPIPLAKILSIFTSIYYKLTKTTPRLTPYSIYVLTYPAFASDKKARQELGYSPRPIRESIADAIKWYRENGMV